VVIVWCKDRDRDRTALRAIPICPPHRNCMEGACTHSPRRVARPCVQAGTPVAALTVVQLKVILRAAQVPVPSGTNKAGLVVLVTGMLYTGG
jgi:hypothetical protein